MTALLCLPLILLWEFDAFLCSFSSPTFSQPDFSLTQKQSYVFFFFLLFPFFQSPHIPGIPVQVQCSNSLRKKAKGRWNTLWKLVYLSIWKRALQLHLLPVGVTHQGVPFFMWLRWWVRIWSWMWSHTGFNLLTGSTSQAWETYYTCHCFFSIWTESKSANRPYSEVSTVRIKYDHCAVMCSSPPENAQQKTSLGALLMHCIPFHLFLLFFSFSQAGSKAKGKLKPALVQQIDFTGQNAVLYTIILTFRLSEEKQPHVRETYTTTCGDHKNWVCSVVSIWLREFTALTLKSKAALMNLRN